MSYTGIKKFPLWNSAAAELARYRFVVTTTSAAAYAGAGNTPTGVTTAAAGVDGSTYQVSVSPLDSMDSTFYIQLGGTVAAGDKLFAGTSGVAVAATHLDIIDRGKQASAPGTPTSGDKYIIPADGWSAAHANAVAVYTTGWAYTDVSDTANVGLTVFVADEGAFVQWNGTAWVKVVSKAIALEAGVTGQDIAAKAVVVADSPLRYNIKSVGSYTCVSTAAAQAITDVNIEANDQVFVTPIASDGTAYIIKAVPTAGTLTVTYSAAVSTNCSLAYMVVEPFGATA